MFKRIIVICMIVLVFIMLYFVVTSGNLKASSPPLKLHGKKVTWGIYTGCDCTKRAYDCKCVLHL